MSYISGNTYTASYASSSSASSYGSTGGYGGVRRATKRLCQGGCMRCQGLCKVEVLQ